MDDEMIQDQYEEIFEVFYMSRGSIGIGYRLFNEVFYGKKMRIGIGTTNQETVTTINDYSSLYNKCSEFLYYPIDIVEGFGMRKHLFWKLMQLEQGKKLRYEIAMNYKYFIQEPLHSHRDETADRFKNRIDYVNIEAYGLGKVTVDNEYICSHGAREVYVQPLRENSNNTQPDRRLVDSD